MISFEEFKEILREGVANNIDAEVTVVTVLKNNGIKLDALSIKSKSSNIAPLIYIASYYDEYSKGRGIESIVDSIIMIYKRESGISYEMISKFTDYSIMKDYIQTKLINKKSNLELLENVPHKDFLDLAIVCMAILPFEEEQGDGQGDGTILVNRYHMERWGISEEEMFNVAIANSMEKNPAVIRVMNEIIKEMYIENALEVQEEDEICAMIDSMDCKLYVLTGTRKYNGAVVITYENVLRDFAKEKNCNIYILPSSIHEGILVLEEEGMSAVELREMVKSVNQTQLAETEVLSNSVYYYDRETNKITIA